VDGDAEFLTRPDSSLFESLPKAGCPSGQERCVAGAENEYRVQVDAYCRVADNVIMATRSSARKLQKVEINRAPVLTLWAAVVAERLGFDRDEALTLGKAIAGLNAQSKGRRLGIYKPSKIAGAKNKKSSLKPGQTLKIDFLNRVVIALRTPEGVRAIDKEKPVDPGWVKTYLKGKFGENLSEVRAAMVQLAKSRTPGDLAEEAFSLYEAFRPQIPAGKKGWGAAGILDLDWIRSL